MIAGLCIGQFNAQAREVEIELFVEPQWTFDAVFDFHGGLAAVEYFTAIWGGYHDLGYIGLDGDFVIPPVYRHAFTFYAYRGAPHFVYGTAGIMSREDGGVAFFNARGERLTDFIFTDARNFSDGLAATRIGRDGWEFDEDEQEPPAPQWGFVDVYGNIAIPFEFDYVADFSEGLAAVLRGNYFGFINTAGELVIPFDFMVTRSPFMEEPYLPYFLDGRAIITYSTSGTVAWHGDEDTTSTSIIDTNGNIIMSFSTGWVMPFTHDRIIVRNNQESIIMDASGNVLARFEWPEMLSPPRRGYELATYTIRVGHEIRQGFVNTDGDVVIAPQFNSVNPFSEGLAAVRDDHHRWGFINERGDLIIPHAFDDVRDFSEGFAAVMQLVDGHALWGYVDTEGNIAVPLVFHHARDFSEGLAWVGMPNPRYD